MPRYAERRERKSDPRVPAIGSILTVPQLLWPLHHRPREERKRRRGRPIQFKRRYVLATLGAAYLLKLSGFCFSAPGWHSDRSLIEAAFQYELGGGWSNTPAVADVDAFIDAHPRCCSVSNS
jgi:hypothetical protein